MSMRAFMVRLCVQKLIDVCVLNTYVGMCMCTKGCVE